MRSAALDKAKPKTWIQIRAIVSAVLFASLSSYALFSPLMSSPRDALALGLLILPIAAALSLCGAVVLGIPTHIWLQSSARTKYRYYIAAGAAIGLVLSAGWYISHQNDWLIPLAISIASIFGAIGFRLGWGTPAQD